MSDRALLRVALGALLFFLFGHTMGMLADSGRGPLEAAALGALGAFTFDAMGVQRSHLDFYTGLGWYLSLALAVLSGMVWQIGARMEAHPAVVRPLLLGPALFCAVSTGLCAWWFFPLPLAASAVAAGALGALWWRAV